MILFQLKAFWNRKVLTWCQNVGIRRISVGRAFHSLEAAAKKALCLQAIPLTLSRPGQSAARGPHTAREPLLSGLPVIAPVWCSSTCSSPRQTVFLSLNKLNIKTIYCIAFCLKSISCLSLRNKKLFSICED